MFTKSVEKVEAPRFNRKSYELHFDKLINKIKKQKIIISEPVELMYLQHDLKVPVSIISESLECSNGLVCGYVNKNLAVHPEKQVRLKQLIDFAINVLEQKVAVCNNITQLELERLQQLLEKGRKILYGKNYNNAKIKRSQMQQKQQQNVFLSGGH
ncbi:MAG: hypothetical protein HQL69_19305 [Magnetococcales bacterium]|nr:hypothetical protein [Magnetococcales bacterium]